MHIEQAPLFTLAQVAERLQVSTKTVRRWIENDDLIAHRLGRQLRISEADLQAFIKARREP
jgi:excisionase family DNA binding protein